MTESHAITIPPECGPTLERIQSVLDRIHPPSILDSDPHVSSCTACRERIAAARRLLVSFAQPSRASVPSNLASAILSGVKRDRIERARTRRRLAAASLMVAAVAGILTWGSLEEPNRFASRALPLPVPATQAPAPERSRPIQVNEELARAGEALKESSRAITEPAASTPRMIAALADTLLNAPASPIGVDFGPAGKSLTEIPDAARAGLEPVAGTAQKAWNRLLRDVAAMQPKVKS